MPILGQTLVTADTPVGSRTRCWAAFLQAGGRVVVSGPSALALHGLATDDERVHIASLRLRNRDRYPQLVVHRDRIGPDELVLDDDGLLLADRRRALVDSLRFVALEEAQRVLDEAFRLRWVDVDWLVAQAHRFAGRRGGPQLVALAKANREGGVGPGERRLHSLLLHAGITGWIANAAIHDDRGLIGYGDVVFPRQRIVLEVDGRAHHTDADRFQRDRTRQNRLVNAGWIVLRFTWQDLDERPREVIAQVRGALRTTQRAS